MSPSLGRGSAIAGQVSSKTIKLLGAERERFFQKTSELPESGYSSGGMGSEHEIVFPIGRSDVLYYISFMAEEKDANGDFKRGPALAVTKWAAFGRSYRKVWHVPFYTSNRSKPHLGTLSSMAFSDGMDGTEQFQPDTACAGWALAKEDLERLAPYAVYRYGQDGDVSQQAWAYVYDARDKILELKPNLRDSTHRDGSGTYFFDVMIVLPAEVKLMKASRPKTHRAAG